MRDLVVEPGREPTNSASSWGSTPRPKLDDRLQSLTVTLVGDPEDRAVHNRRMLEEHLFYLAGAMLTPPHSTMSDTRSVMVR